MSTARRFQPLKFLFCVTMLIGMSVPTSANDKGIPEMSVVEQMFWICLEDNKGTSTASGVQCCDGGACYTCFSDFSECWISNDPAGRAAQKVELRSQRPIVSPLQERPSEGRLQSICISVRARFTSLAGFGYSCLKPNCDGIGNNCAIICHDNSSCVAQMPDVIGHALTLRGILQNGDNIDHRSQPASGGGANSYAPAGDGSTIF